MINKCCGKLALVQIWHEKDEVGFDHCFMAIECHDYQQGCTNTSVIASDNGIFTSAEVNEFIHNFNLASLENNKK